MNKIIDKLISLIIISSLLVLTSCNSNVKSDIVHETLIDTTDKKLYSDDAIYQFDILSFGKLNDEDITWFVVENHNDYIVLFCEKVLDLIPYNDSGIDVNFEDSSIYRYMENDFIVKYFSEKEKKEMLNFTDDLKVSLPTLDNLRDYFGEINIAKSGYYGDKDYYKANKSIIAKPIESSTNDLLVDNAFNNKYFASYNRIEIDERYDFANGSQPYWIYDGNDLYVNYVTATGYVSRTMQNNQYIGFRPIIKLRK